MPQRRKVTKYFFTTIAFASSRLGGNKVVLLTILVFSCLTSNSQVKSKYTRADSLRGNITKERAWWNVVHYDLHVKFDAKDSTISGYNKMSYIIQQPYDIMQIDLQSPLIMDSVVQSGKQRKFKREGNAYIIYLEKQVVRTQRELLLYYHGKPRVALMPPWDGGLVWQKDSRQRTWISIACQGLGASVWFPNKDHQYDEPDSVSIHITAPNELQVVSNGRLRSQKINKDGTATYNWAVVNPINSYNIIPYIGHYVHFGDTMTGEGGKLDLDFWVLEDDLDKAKEQFKQAKPMLHCFEYWFGKYPFYEDGYKLVQSPYLGMEHQSAVAYGNKFGNGYFGKGDLSQTGWGLKWDFIIVHESGHEWFGNNISTIDIADNWIHEGFTAYSENLYTEYLFGKEAGADYVIGTRRSIKNDIPLIGDYCVNQEGSGDIYYKGANMLHTLRQMVNNDVLWRELLRKLNKVFWHQTVNTQQIESYMAGYLKMDLEKFFEQYLRTTKIPVLEWNIEKQMLMYRFSNCINGFSMPVKIKMGDQEIWITPNEKWQTMPLKDKKIKKIFVDRNFYISDKKL